MTEKLKKAHSGKKSYLIGGLFVALGVAIALGFAAVPDSLKGGEQLAGMLSGLVGLAVGALRAAISKTGVEVPDAVVNAAAEKAAEKIADMIEKRAA